MFAWDFQSCDYEPFMCRTQGIWTLRKKYPWERCQLRESSLLPWLATTAAQARCLCSKEPGSSPSWYLPAYMGSVLPETGERC